MENVKNCNINAWDAARILASKSNYEYLQYASYLAQDILNVSRRVVVNDKGENIVDMFDRFVKKHKTTSGDCSTGYIFMHDICKLSDDEIEELIEGDIYDEYVKYYHEWADGMSNELLEEVLKQTDRRGAE